MSEHSPSSEPPAAIDVEVDGGFSARPALPYKASEGDVEDVVVTFNDVTVLREHDLRIQSLLDSTAEGIYGIDLQGRCTFANAACVRLLGYASPDDLIGRDMHALIHHAQADGTPYPRSECKIHHGVTTGEQAHMDGEVLWRRDGSSFDVEYWSSPILRDGSIAGGVVTFLDISERRQVLHDLRRSDARLRLALEAAHINAFEWDIAGDAVRRPFGSSAVVPDTEEPHSFEDVVQGVHPDDRAAFRASVDQALESPDGVYSSEYRIVERDGTIRWLSERGRVEFDPAGKPVRLTGMSQDVTERKQVEELRHTLAAIVESSRDAIIGKTLDGIVTSWNHGAELLYGYTAEEMVGEPISKIIPDELRIQLEDLMCRLRRGEWVRSLETYRIAKDGSRRDISLTVSVINRADGVAVGASAIARDITARRRHERDLQRSRERLRLALAAAELGTFDSDLPTGQVVWDERAATIFDLPADATMEALTLRIHRADRERWTKGVARAKSGQEGASGEYRVVRSDGSTRWVLLQIGVEFELASGGGQIPVRLVGAVADITTRKSVEIARREAERRKDEFLAMLGHELRNPLAAIRSATELVQLVAAEAHTPLARAKDVLQRQVGQMTRLVDGLLEVARITRGKIELKREILDLRTVTAQAVQDRDHAVRNDAVGLRCDVPPEPLWVDADEARIVQILDNLLGNALRFTEDGVVRCDLRRDGDHAVMEVSDTGTGIDPAALPWLFEPFRQQTGGGGLGLGLALVKGLVDLHGGTVTGHSEGLGQGARFTVRLPLAERSVADGGENARLDVPPQQILIVEDNTDAGQILRELLIARGHDCEVAEEGGQALEMLRARGRSVVLCDLGLPDMTGHDVARAIRADPSQQGTRLIAISGYGQPGDRQRATEAGFDAHLTKPVELDTLEDLIGRLVRRR